MEIKEGQMETVRSRVASKGGRRSIDHVMLATSQCSRDGLGKYRRAGVMD